ncbi:hypothetical protein PUN28_009874 [Cardiocondyla obscurior]|uniref:Uncharacterized protein n=1 Tax=Cardiocondyla obscurior TaxID=286306 RepID=A0AAW2FL09_9HYME
MTIRSASLQSGNVLHIYCAPFAASLATAAALSAIAPFCQINQTLKYKCTVCNHAVSINQLISYIALNFTCDILYHTSGTFLAMKSSFAKKVGEKRGIEEEKRIARRNAQIDKNAGGREERRRRKGMRGTSGKKGKKTRRKDERARSVNSAREFGGNLPDRLRPCCSPAAFRAQICSRRRRGTTQYVRRRPSFIAAAAVRSAPFRSRRRRRRRQAHYDARSDFRQLARSPTSSAMHKILHKPCQPARAAGLPLLKRSPRAKSRTADTILAGSGRIGKAIGIMRRRLKKRRKGEKKKGNTRRERKAKREREKGTTKKETHKGRGGQESSDGGAGRDRRNRAGRKESGKKSGEEGLREKGRKGRKREVLSGVRGPAVQPRSALPSSPPSSSSSSSSSSLAGALA